jgi:hypothetical protein
VKVPSAALETDNPPGGDDEDEDGLNAEREIARSLLRVLCDGSPLVRAELAIGELPWLHLCSITAVILKYCFVNLSVCSSLDAISSSSL